MCPAPCASYAIKGEDGVEEGFHRSASSHARDDIQSKQKKLKKGIKDILRLGHVQIYWYPPKEIIEICIYLPKIKTE